MLQKAKSSLLRLLICLCLACCLVAVLIGAVACEKQSDPTIVSAEMVNGELVLKWSDGTESRLPLKGLDGSQGAPGAAGSDGISIQSVEWLDGKLHITFSNGESTDIDINIDAVECPVNENGKHDFTYAELHELKKADCVSRAITVNICKCGAATVEEVGEIDPNNHAQALVKTHQDPTCTEPGFDKWECPACTKSDSTEIAALNHTKMKLAADGTEGTEENWITVVDEGKNKCIDGGSEILVCGRCFEYVYEEKVIDVIGHHTPAADWTMTKAPSKTEAGVLSGFCSVCEENVTVEIPVLTDDMKNVGESVTAECNKPGKDVYDLTVGAWTGKLELTVTALHKFAEGKDANLDEVYNIDEYREYIKPISNEPLATCAQNGEGVFTCSSCGGTFKVVISGSHKQGEIVTEVKSTCNVQGSITYKCDNEGCPSGGQYTVADATWESTKETLHKWGPVEPTMEDIKIVSVKQTCTVCGKTNEIKLAKYEEDTENQANVKVSCKADGVQVYKYWITDETGAGAPDGTFTVTVPQLKHEGANGISVYDADLLKEPFSYKLVDKVIANATLATCLEEGEGVFECTHCGETLKVRVIGDHTYKFEGAEPTEADKALADEIAPQTCETAETWYFDCTVCGKAEARKEYVNGTAKGHSYTGEPEQDIHYAADGVKIESITFTWTCDNGCGTTKTVTGLPDPAHSDKTYGEGYEYKEATCNEKGYLKFWYTEQGGDGTAKELLVREIAESTTVHTLSGKTLDITQVHSIKDVPAELLGNADPEPTCSTPGEAIFECEVCGKTWKIMIQLEHEWTDETKDTPIVVNPTCTTDGYSYKICKLCNEQITVEGSVTVAQGHKFVVKADSLSAPTKEAAGSVEFECSVCKEVKKVDLPALTDEAYSTAGSREATCDSDGYELYTFKVTAEEGSKDTYADVQITVPVSALGHTKSESSKLVTWESADGKTTYSGYLCDVCGKAIVESSSGKTDPDPDPDPQPTVGFNAMEEPVAGDYIIGMWQNNLDGGKYIYLNGSMDGYYFASTDDPTAAATVTLIDEGDGNWTIKLGDKFIEIVKNGNYNNVVFQETQTEGLYWHWNETYKIFTLEVEGTEYYLGTFASNKTFSANGLFRIEDEGVIGVSQFVAYLGTYVAE